MSCEVHSTGQSELRVIITSAVARTAARGLAGADDPSTRPAVEVQVEANADAGITGRMSGGRLACMLCAMVHERSH